MNTHNRHGLTVGGALLLGLVVLGMAIGFIALIIWMAKAIWLG